MWVSFVLFIVSLSADEAIVVCGKWLPCSNPISKQTPCEEEF